MFFEETINNRYIKFILTELLGELEKEKTIRRRRRRRRKGEEEKEEK
jgi:hypothetical protein